jgi:RNA polymerase sigma factor (sigma-70 family)
MRAGTTSLAGVVRLSDTPARAIRIRTPPRTPAPVSTARSAHSGSTDPKRDPDMDPKMPNDEATARRFRDAVMPHLDDACNLARFLTRNAADADDIVQDAYLRAFRFFATFRGENPRAWLFAIVRNCFYSSLKGRSRGESLTDVDLDSLDAATVTSDLWTSESDDPERTLIKLDDANVVRALIEALPVPFRETLVLREMEEMSYQDIATITEVPIGTVMSRLARARQLFKAAWLDHQAKERR